MEPKKPHLCYPVAVEGKYDKIKLESLFEGEFFVTNGFSFFKDEGKKALFRRLAEKTRGKRLTSPENRDKLQKLPLCRGFKFAILICIAVPYGRGVFARTPEESSTK